MLVMVVARAVELLSNMRSNFREISDWLAEYEVPPSLAFPHHLLSTLDAPSSPFLASNPSLGHEIH
jgi:hypothetical protein